MLAFAKIAQTLTISGHAIISVPYARAHCSGIWYRVYTREEIEQKLEEHFVIEEKKYYYRENNEWDEAEKENDPSLPFDGVALFLLAKNKLF